MSARSRYAGSTSVSWSAPDNVPSYQLSLRVVIEEVSLDVFEEGRRASGRSN